MNCEECAQEYRRTDAARDRNRCEKQKEHKCPTCHFYTKSKEEMDYHVAMKHAEPSSKQFALLVNKSSQVITLSNNIGEKNMELGNGNPVIL